MDIIYYGELDPYSGVDQHASNLPLVIAELQFIVLLYDVVLLPPDNLLDHRLALPAFEALAPFVRAGRLTTTADASLATPFDLVQQKLDLYSEDQPRRSASAHGLQRSGTRALPYKRTGSVAAYRRQALAEIGQRWRSVLPPTWTLRRDVPAQVAAFAERLELGCSERPNRAVSSSDWRSTPVSATRPSASPSRVTSSPPRCAPPAGSFADT